MAGRGAWSTVGGTYEAEVNGRTYGFYDLRVEGPLVGDMTGHLDPEFNDYAAVHQAVRGYQLLLDRQLDRQLDRDLSLTGRYGEATRDAAEKARVKFGYLDLTEGRIGHTLATRLMRTAVTLMEERYRDAGYLVPQHVPFGIGAHESEGYDLAAVGEDTDTDQTRHFDKGPFQFRCLPRPNNYTWWNRFFRGTEMAVEPPWVFRPLTAAEQCIRRVIYYAHHFSDRGPLLQRQCAILQHNSLKAAESLYANGVFSSPTAESYVERVEERIEAAF